MDISLTNREAGIMQVLAVPRLAGRNVAALAVIVLALLGAGCADQPQQAGQAAVQSTNVATTAPATPTAVSDDDPLECDYLVPAGTATHQWICFAASQQRPAAAKDDDPLECQYVVPTGTMMHKWACISASDRYLQRQRNPYGSSLSVSD